MRTTRSQKLREEAELAEALELSKQTISQPSTIENIQLEEPSQSEETTSCIEEQPWADDMDYNQPPTPEPTPEPSDQRILTLIEITNPLEIEQLNKKKVKQYTRGKYNEKPKEHHKHGEITKIQTHQLRTNRNRAIKFQCAWNTNEQLKWETWETVLNKSPDQLVEYLKEQATKNKKTWNALVRSKPEIMEIIKEN